MADCSLTFDIPKLPICINMTDEDTEAHLD